MQTHELDVTKYSLEELFGLFKLSPCALDSASLKSVRHWVLMTHPDKSNLPAKYFLFYKRAYDIIAEFAAENTKRDANVVSAATTQIEARRPNADLGNSAIRRAAAKVDTETFNRMFTSATPKSAQRDNTWFYEDSIVSSTSAQPGRIGEAMESLRTRPGGVHTTALVSAATAAATLHSGNAYYDPDEDADCTDYIQSDVFSRLRFEDLRKVHRDQSIFSVSEAQFDSSSKQNQSRRDDIAPISEDESWQILRADQSKWTEMYLQKEYAAKLRSNRAANASRAVMAQFMQIEH
jgi:hypothetical protein